MLKEKRWSKSLLYLGLMVIALTAMMSCQADTPIEDVEEETTLIPLKEEYDEARNKWGFIDKSGKIVIDGNYDEVNNYAEGKAAFRKKADWGFIDASGKEIISAQFYNAFNFKNGRAKVCTFKRKYGIIDQQGEYIIPCEYDDIRTFAEDLCAVKSDGKWGYVNKQNELVIPFQYASVKDFKQGMAIVKQNGNMILINQKGKQMSAVYEKLSALNNGLYKYRKDKKFGILDKNGKLVLKNKYTMISQMDDTVFAVKEGDDYFLRSLNKEKINVPENNGIQYLSANRWGYEKNGKIGLIDNEGKIIKTPRFKIVTPYSNGFASYQSNHLWGYIDTAGEKITPAIFGLTWEFKEGLARVITRDGIGFINPQGNLEFIAQNYDVRDFHEGLARMPIN